MKYCIHCGKEITETADLCMYCGKKQTETAEESAGSGNDSIDAVQGGIETVQDSGGRMGGLRK